MRLVYLSPLPWDSFAQRPHKFVQWFHNRTGEPVLWINPYPTRFPKWADFRRLRKPLSTSQFSVTPSWLKVLNPGGLPIEPIPGSGRINKSFWHHIFANIDSFASESDTLLTFGRPSVLSLELLKRLPHCVSLYDAMDDFPAFYTGLSRLAMARRELSLVQRIDILWSSSSQLKERWSPHRKDVHLVHNGLDISALPKVEPTQTTAPNKTFGYVGTIASWFDWDWLHALAEARPNDEIRLIGPVFEKPINKLPKNVEILPACDHQAALNAMLEFDIGLIPFKKNALTASVDPIKYYEYRALALPVISTDFGEMRYRSNSAGVFVSHSVYDIAPIAEAALQFKNTPKDAHLFALQNTWEARFDATRLLP